MDLVLRLQPWLELVREQVPGLELFDVHTHLGRNDPDGMSQTPEQLLATLDVAGAVGAFVFPMHEPAGYPPANDEVLGQARAQGKQGLQIGGHPPGQILFASDAPYGMTAMSAAFQIRAALQVGLSPEQTAVVPDPGRHGGQDPRRPHPGGDRRARPSLAG